MEAIVRCLPMLLACGVVLFPLCLWVLAISLEHINPLFPYVSDLGIEPPEASLFSLCMCGGSAFIALFVLLRYDLILAHIGRSKFLNISHEAKTATDNDKDPATIVNIGWQARASFVSGLLMALGFLLLGCFRNNETHFVQLLHNIFAGLGFSSALLDMFFAIDTASLLGYERTAHRRRLILWTSVVFLVVYTTNGVASFVTNPAAYADKHARLLWSPQEDGYFLHVVSSVVEWLLVYSLAIYFYTFQPMFVRARLSNVNNNNNKDTSPA